MGINSLHTSAGQKAHSSTTLSQTEVRWSCRGTTNWNLLPWPGLTVSTFRRHLTIGEPGKEWETKKLPTTGRIGKDQKEGRDSSPYVLPTFQNPPLWKPLWLSNACAARKDPESEWLARDNPEANPITIKPKISSHVTERFSRIPGHSLPGHPFPIVSLFVSMCVLGQFISKCETGAHSWALEGVLLPATKSLVYPAKTARALCWVSGLGLCSPGNRAVQTESTAEQVERAKQSFLPDRLLTESFHFVYPSDRAEAALSLYWMEFHLW